YRAARKKPRRDLRPADILDLVKTQRPQPRMKRGGVKMVAELLADRRDPRNQRLMHGAPARFGHRIRRIDVIENDLRATRQSGNETERRKDRLIGEIRHDAKPGKKRLLRRIETGRVKLLRQC